MEEIIEMYRKMEERLNVIAGEESSVIQTAQRSYKIADASMNELKAFIGRYEFKSKEEEITFFKTIKPKFYSKLIYFIRLFEIESGYRAGSQKSKRRYLRRKLSAANIFFKENGEFCKYLRTGATYLDELYFTRHPFDLNLGLDLSYFDCDPAFSTSHDYKVALLMANEELCAHINQAIAALNGKAATSPVSLVAELKLGWAETKAALTELLYALHSAGVFCSLQPNNTVELKQVALFMEVCFGVSLGNYSRTFQEIRIRKKGRTAFLDKLIERLKQRMDDADE